MIDFKNCTLYITPRSPFARRVRLTFREHNISYEEKVMDVFKPSAELEEINPLKHIPVLKLKTGELIVDSNSILTEFYLSHPQSPLLPKNISDRATSGFWSGVAVGLCEGLVTWYLETLRPKENQSADLFEEYRGIFKDCLSRFEKHMAGKKFVAGPDLSQGDLDMATALAYFALRYEAKWGEQYPNAAAFMSRLGERPSFQQTVPPPA